MRLEDIAPDGVLTAEHIPGLRRAWEEVSTQLSEGMAHRVRPGEGVQSDGWWVLEFLEDVICKLQRPPAEMAAFEVFDPGKQVRMLVSANRLPC